MDSEPLPDDKWGQTRFDRIGEGLDRVRTGMPQKRYKTGPSARITRSGICQWCFRAVRCRQPSRSSGPLLCGRDSPCQSRCDAVLTRHRASAARQGVLDDLTRTELLAARLAAFDPDPMDKPSREIERRGVHPVRQSSRWARPQRGKCQLCRRRLRRRHPEMDHMRQKQLGGPNSVVNIRWLCGACHRERHRVFRDDCDITGPVAQAILAHLEANVGSVKAAHLEATRTWAARQSKLYAAWETGGGKIEWLTFVRCWIDTGGLAK